MSDTADIRIYRIREKIDINQIITSLTSISGYHEVEFDELIQQKQEIEIRAFVKQNTKRPDWLGMVDSYLKNSSQFKQVLKYDFIALISCKSKDGRDFTFAFCSGSGYHRIADHIDYTFGISVLESVFNPKFNKISAVAEKGIVGDILASRRFYRRARPLGYEDDFGIYYQNIITRFSGFQIKQEFPSLANYKGEKLKPTISMSGSASIEIQMKINFITLIRLFKDLAELMTVESPRIFNKNLIPLDIRRDKELITELNEKLFDNLVDFYLDPDKYPIDFDFCYRDFDTFFGSAACHFIFHGLTNKMGGKVEPVETEDIYDLGNPSFIRTLFNKIEGSDEYQKTDDARTFMKDALKSVQVVTLDDESNETTSGRLREYLQQELEKDGISYFLLDDRWYRLQNEFDSSLMEKYTIRLRDKFQVYDFVHKWNCPDETAYNKLYDSQPSSFYLHLIKVDHIELCDALVVDTRQKKIYILHVKDGIGATIRDLTSQVYIAARIIEEESRTEVKEKLNKLYEQAIYNDRIDSKKVSREYFLQWITSFSREYILVIHDSDKSVSDIKEGKFKSRIAKHSLVEFESAMRGNGWNFSICCVGT